MSTLENENNDISTVVTAGTGQSLVDVGCVPHDPQLYQPDYIWPDGIEVDDFLNTSKYNIDDNDAIMERLVQKFHRDGFIVIPDAVSMILQNSQDDTAMAARTYMDALDVAVDELINGTNEPFSNAVKDVISLSSSSSNYKPDFTNGDKIPYIQYEAGTNLSSSASLLTPSTASKVRKIMGFVGYHPTIDALVHHPKLINIVSRLLLHSHNNSTNDDSMAMTSDHENTEIELFQDMALLKPPNGGREKPWHQDKAYFNIHVLEPVVGCWMAIDPATIDNGCLRFELKSKRTTGSTTMTTTDDLVQYPLHYPPEMHFMVRDYQICDTVDRRAKVMAVPVPPGGMILFDGMSPHGTPTNTMTSSRRRALQFHWTRC